MNMTPEHKILNEAAQYHLEFSKDRSPQLWDRFCEWLKTDTRHADAYLHCVFVALASFPRKASIGLTPPEGPDRPTPRTAL